METDSNKEESQRIGRLVRAEKLQLLFNQSFPAIPLSFLIASLLSYILWPVQEASILIAWLAVLGIIALVRCFLFVSYWKDAPEGEDILAWEKPYFITLAIATAAWGVGAVFVMPSDSTLHQAVVYYFLIGMAGGAISVYSAHRSMTLVTFSILLLPTTVVFIASGNFVLSGMAAAGIMYFISTIRSGKILSVTLNQSFMLAHELKQAKDKAEQLSLIDELSGLENRRAFYEKGKLLVEYCKRNGKMLGLIVMDIDKFKDINDNHGHAAGDEAIRQIGTILKTAIRKSDVAARIGGEEFALLLVESDHAGAENLAKKLLKAIKSTPINSKENQFTLSASFGVSVCDCDIELLFKRADEALYRAKNTGRGCVVVDGCAPGTELGSVKVEIAS